MPASRSNKSKKVNSTRKSNKARNNNTKKSHHGFTVSGIKSRFAKLDESVRGFLDKHKNKPRELAGHISRQWNDLFKKHLSAKSAATLASHFSKTGKKVKMAGGNLAGAPLDYTMRPGMPGVSSYGVFPTEMGADPKSVGHLDVYYNSGLARSCGHENTTASVPANMGSNKVGGARRRNTRKARGGNFALSLGTRPYIAASPSDSFQRINEAAMGQAPWTRDTPDPTTYAWKTVVGTGPSLMNPNGITEIKNDITQLANKSPYPAVSF
jgi:hypothetical protein